VADSYLICSGGTLAQNVDGSPVCTGGTWQFINYVPPFDVSQLDPTEISAAFAAGFSVVSVPIIFAVGVSSILNTIRGKK
jgi:Na+-driven multidrug efflux pump